MKETRLDIVTTINDGGREIEIRDVESEKAVTQEHSGR